MSGGMGCSCGAVWHGDRLDDAKALGWGYDERGRAKCPACLRLYEIPLTDVLAASGIRHEEHNGISRKLYRGEEYLGAFTASEAWEYVRRLQRPAEDLTPEGIQLVIPGAERVQAPEVKQMELF